MSLLMDALKRAEEAKRLAAQNPPLHGAPAGGRPLELLPLTPSTETPTAAAAAHEPEIATAPPIAQESVADATAPPLTAAYDERREAAERLAARNLFQAKQPPRSRSGLLIAAAIAALLALAMIGYYAAKLYALNTPPAPALPSPAARTLPPPLPQPSPPLATPSVPAAQPAASPSATPAAARTETPKPYVEPRQPPNPPATPDSPVRLSRSTPKTNAALEKAYVSLQSGQLDDAQRGYEQVLRGDARNVDALLGLATLAARRGQDALAQTYYQQAYDADPKDPTAQAGVINTRGKSNPAQSESQLKIALSGQPESPALNLALGNLYAAQGRWSEAQQAYFNAYSADPENPDLIFNLAVSLDHLRQTKLAAQYYATALRAASGARAGSFDPAQVRNRLLELQP